MITEQLLIFISPPVEPIFESNQDLLTSERTYKGVVPEDSLEYARRLASSWKPPTLHESVHPLYPFSLHDPDLRVFSAKGPPTAYELAQKWLNKSPPSHSEYPELGPPFSIYDPRPVGRPPPEAALKPETENQILEDLRELAAWLRPRGGVLPDPIVGGLEFDPTGVTDRLGVKGMSVYTAFIDFDSLRCRICGAQSSAIELALLHQRTQRHFQ